MKRFNKKDIFTIPNLIGYLRLLLIPVFCWVYITADSSRDYLLAAGIVLFSSFTDLFDGMIARKFNQVTELGKILDPVADKLTHGAMAICLATRYPLMWALIALMALKEGYMAVMGLHFLKKDKMLDGAMWFGKICTATLFTGLCCLFFFYQISSLTANILISVMMVVMLITLCMYVPVFKQMKKDIERENGNIR